MTNFTDQRADLPADQRLGSADQRPASQWPSGYPSNQDRRQRIKDELLSPRDRADLEDSYGKVIAPIIADLLESKAVEMEERWRQAWLKTYKQFFGDSVDAGRDVLLVSREEAADLLGTSLSTVKRMEAAGELPEPIRFNERVVRHRLVDIEAMAKTRLAVWPED